MKDYKFTAQDKREECEKEVQYRIRVYQRLVAQGKMVFETAQRRTAIMKAIARDYAEIEQKTERLL